MGGDQWKSPVSCQSSLITWVVEQMYGIADALRTMHSFHLADGRTAFGRHGDVKATNILLYSSTPGTYLEATLKLADMGSSIMFLDEQSRWNIKPGPGTGTYEPPECDLLEPQSQAYDMWMLGCMFLEFLVWLLRGPAGLREFGEQRWQTSLFHGALFTNDYFYVLEYDNIEEKATNAKLRPSVQQTIISLQHMLEDIPPLRDLLSIVEELLRTDQRDRISSTHLCTKMKKLLPGR
jgi:serine/threonine protein kinase